MKAILYRDILRNKDLFLGALILIIAESLLDSIFSYLYFAFLLFSNKRMKYDIYGEINSEQKRFKLMPLTKLDYIKEYYLFTIIYSTYIVLTKIITILIFNDSTILFIYVVKYSIFLLGIIGLFAVWKFTSSGFMDKTIYEGMYMTFAACFALYGLISIIYPKVDFTITGVISIVGFIGSYLYLKNNEEKCNESSFI